MNILADSKVVLASWSSWEIDGWAPPPVKKILENARLDWLVDLTDSLRLWTSNPSMTQGELILAYANLGALVEGWLKLFYCVHYRDYIKTPEKYNGKIIEPNKLKFYLLISFSQKINLWDGCDVDMDEWLEKVRLRRNVIHAFDDKPIGTYDEFIQDTETLNVFISEITSRLPIREE